MPIKRVKLTIGKSYVELDIMFDDADIESMDYDAMVNYAMDEAFWKGELKVEIQDTEGAELPISNTKH